MLSIIHRRHFILPAGCSLLSSPLSECLRAFGQEYIGHAVQGIDSLSLPCSLPNLPAGQV